MALYIDGMPCSLCQQPMLDDQPIFGTWGVWLPSTDRLVDFCDAAMHWDCYAGWKYRERFARSYFEFWVKTEKVNPHWWSSYLDEDIFVNVNPGQGISNAWVHLAQTGTRHLVSLDDWERWLHATDDTSPQLESVALEAARVTLRANVRQLLLY